MRIQLLSDLHLESHPYELKPSKYADVIVLAGDIATLRQRDRLLKLFRVAYPKPVVMVTGNHEYYHSDITHVDYQLSLMVEGNPHVRVLNKTWCQIEDFVFVGGTLWTDFRLPMPGKDGVTADPVLAARAALQHISDFRMIRRLSPGGMVLQHFECCAAIERARDFGKPLVVVTHFCPSPRSIHPRYAGDSCNPYFTSNCEHLMGGPVRAWLHGHTHSSFSYDVKGTQVHCNPRGYNASENPAFSDEFLIEVKP